VRLRGGIAACQKKVVGGRRGSNLKGIGCVWLVGGESRRWQRGRDHTEVYWGSGEGGELLFQEVTAAGSNGSSSSSSSNSRLVQQRQPVSVWGRREMDCTWLMCLTPCAVFPGASCCFAG
jgi:hypothetical protein